MCHFGNAPVGRVRTHVLRGKTLREQCENLFKDACEGYFGEEQIDMGKLLKPGPDASERTNERKIREGGGFGRVD